MTESLVVHLDVRGADVDIVSGILWSGGATAVQELAGDGEYVRLLAGVPGSSLDGLRWDLGDRWTLSVEDADYDGWLEAWRPFARPVRAGPFVVYPAWEQPPKETGARIMIPIDAGSVFGQGSHVTTRLVLEQLGSLDLAGASVLDVGTGSGVLATAAALLGAARVHAVDIDSDSVQIARQNAENNGVAGVVSVGDVPIGDIEASHDIVLANILASVLVDLAPAIIARLARGGVLVLSGLLDQQRQRVLEVYGSLDLVSAYTEDGWTVLVLSNPSADTPIDT